MKTLMGRTFGSLQVALSCWSVYLGSMFSRAWNSTVSLNFVLAALRAVSRASSGSSGLVIGGTLARAACIVTIMLFES